MSTSDVNPDLRVGELYAISSSLSKSPKDLTAPVATQVDKAIQKQDPKTFMKSLSAASGGLGKFVIGATVVTAASPLLPAVIITALGIGLSAASDSIAPTIVCAAIGIVLSCYIFKGIAAAIVIPLFAATPIGWIALGVGAGLLLLGLLAKYVSRPREQGPKEIDEKEPKKTEAELEAFERSIPIFVSETDAVVSETDAVQNQADESQTSSEEAPVSIDADLSTSDSDKSLEDELAAETRDRIADEIEKAQQAGNKLQEIIEEL